MRYEYSLGRTLFVFIMSLLVLVLGALNLNAKDEIFVMALSSVVFMAPIVIFSGITLFKMWKKSTTKIYHPCDDEFPNGEPFEIRDRADKL